MINMKEKINMEENLNLIFEGFCRKVRVNSSETNILRNYFISKALEFKDEIQRGNFLDDLDYAIFHIENEIESILTKKRHDLLLSKHSKAATKEGREFYSEQLNSLEDYRFPASRIGFTFFSVGLMSIKDVRLIRKAFKEAQDYFKDSDTDTQEIKNENPKVFTNKGYLYFTILDEKYKWDDKPFTKYGLIGRYLVNKGLLANKQKYYIEFINGRIEKNFTRIESYNSDRMEKMTSLFEEILKENKI